MDNIILKKIYEDNEIIEIEITANNNFIKVSQSCYVNAEVLDEIVKKIRDYLNVIEKKCYIEIGNKKGKCTPAFSMEFLAPNVHGHIMIEMDMEICDNDERKHWCKFYIKSEIGLLEKFAEKILNLLKCKIDEEISLNG